MNLQLKSTQSLLLLCFLSLVLLMTSYGCGDDDFNPIPVKVPCTIDTEYLFENNTNLAVDYVIDCETYITGKVTIEPGTVLEFTENGSIIVDDNGSLKAIGTSDSKIIFRGSIDGQGTWRGIHFESKSLNNILDFCQIKNAGNQKWNGFKETSAIAVTGKCKISNSQITENRGIGVYLNPNSEEDALIDFENNEILNNSDFPVSINAYNINALTGNNIYNGNNKEMLRVTADLLFDIDVTFHTNSIPYFVEGDFYKEIRVANDIYGPASLTIQEGVTLVFEENSGIEVAGNGTLMILGSSSNRVELKGEEDLANYWKGIFHMGASTSNIIQHTVINGAASSSFTGNPIRASLRLGGVGACCDKANLKLENVRFENSRCAINIYGDDTTFEMIDVTYVNVDSELCN